LEPELFQVDRGPEGAADQPLDLHGAAVEAALVDVARLPLVGRVGKHRILGGEPAPLDPCCFIQVGTPGSMVAAQITWVAPKRTRTEPVACGAMSGLEGDGAELVGLAAVGGYRVGHGLIRS
jgi:hypothetical protein